MNHLETLTKRYYEWRGYIVRSNIKVGRLSDGGWAGELDVVAYRSETGHLIHLEPSIDAHSWVKREERFEKKFSLGRKHMYVDAFPRLTEQMPLEQIAVPITSSRKELARAHASRH